jgi:hypothetical protein
MTTEPTRGDRCPDGLNVPVVEDGPLMAMSVSDEPEMAGANVIGPAASVQQALALLHVTAPSISRCPT